MVPEGVVVARTRGGHRRGRLRTAKAEVLEEYFTVVADEEVRGRRLIVYERRSRADEVSR
ncbi:hypothetical protein GCM10023323_36310 [Streptomyces thinghirensis]|uniref:Uncharacterized protein n=1 Tax=Streptomyces thinghirensis TaxID=551547 RepID=A0ABP9T3H6_9ACTN